MSVTSEAILHLESLLKQELLPKWISRQTRRPRIVMYEQKAFYRCEICQLPYPTGGNSLLTLPRRPPP